ncbi:hypothetical protein F5Y16DRAFT_421461 [Xylariaceae sp. FL0255]|nr:hypothetical protein F5Y16DRAFT_421461 [Xylariaceae sp. FL0255]
MDGDHPLPYMDGKALVGWSEATLVHSGPFTGGPGLLPTEHIPNGSYDSTIHAASYSHDTYSTHLARTPVLAHALLRSCSPGLAPFHHAFSYPSASPMPRIKIEGHGYASRTGHSQYSSPVSSHAIVMDPSSFGSQMGTPAYLSDVSVVPWSKPDYLSVGTEPYHSEAAGGNRLMASNRRQQTSRTSRAPKRQPRRLTSKEEANFQCEVEGCGKLFRRSYNYKAHKETHDKKREYPFVCTADDCDKKFVRKTDLQRHHQSVHMEEKNQKCDSCGRLFARKDTLMRHVKDGCVKRSEIGTMGVQGGTGSYDASDGLAYIDHQGFQATTLDCSRVALTLAGDIKIMIHDYEPNATGEVKSTDNVKDVNRITSQLMYKKISEQAIHL